MAQKTTITALNKESIRFENNKSLIMSLSEMSDKLENNKKELSDILFVFFSIITSSGIGFFLSIRLYYLSFILGIGLLIWAIFIIIQKKRREGELYKRYKLLEKCCKLIPKEDFMFQE